MEKTITLKLTGIRVEGEVDALLYGGDVVRIAMTPFNVETLEDIPSKVNDGKFGCQKILAAECRVYGIYEGHLVFDHIENFSASELVNAKKGI